MSPVNIKQSERNLVPLASELEAICTDLQDIANHIHFILDHVEL